MVLLKIITPGSHGNTSLQVRFQDLSHYGISTVILVTKSMLDIYKLCVVVVIIYISFSEYSFDICMKQKNYNSALLLI